MNLTALKDHLISAAAGAALLGGGATIITNKIGIAVVEQKVEQLQTLNSNVEGLRADIADLRVELASKEVRNEPRQ